MENEIKNRIINYIISITKKFNSNDFDIDTNDGKVIGISNCEIMIDKYGDSSLILCNDLNDCKITTLYQIVEKLNCELEFILVENELKKKTNYWHKKKRIWTYKPIDKDFIMEKIKMKGRLKKYVAKRTNKIK